MRTHRILLGVTLATISMIGTAALAQEKDVKAFQAEIQAIYSKIPGIWKNHDLKAYSDLFTADVQFIAPNGKTHNLSADLALAKADMAATGKIRSAKIVFHRTGLQGNEAVSDATEIWDNDLIDTKGEYGPKGKVYPIIWRVHSTQTHVKRGKNWLLKRYEAKGEPTITSGGKPLVPLAKKKNG